MGWRHPIAVLTIGCLAVLCISSSSVNAQYDYYRNCREDQYQCLSGTCIARFQICNNIPDCPNGDDEENCHTQCTDAEYKCKDGSRCLSDDQVCDGEKNCPSGDDEEDCETDTYGPKDDFKCLQNEFECTHDLLCISNDLVCDGHNDCFYGEDEINCQEPSPVCRPDQFECDQHFCVSGANRCDGIPNCIDGTDELNCTTCQVDTFHCHSGECLLYKYRCDGRSDCVDSSDEFGCVRCRPGEFECGDGTCLSQDERCDTIPQCADGTDELGCTYGCQSDQFKCNDNTCIDRSAECDGRQDCPDASDESNCVQPPRICQNYQWQCTNGQCINAYARCDGRADCPDSSDEVGCPTKPITDPQLSLKTYPSSQIIKESREVVFRCRDEGPTRARVKWTRPGGRPLPPGFSDKNGRLEIPNIRIEDAGEYVCEAVGYPSFTPGQKVTVHLTVDKYNPMLEISPQACGYHEATCANGECISKSSICDGIPHCTDGSDEHSCSYGRKCNPNQFNCKNGKCVDRTWRCDGENDCGDNSDEESCDPSPSSSPCRYDEFQCKSGECLPKTFHCDRSNDCKDGSDEHGCMSPVVIQPPPPKLVLPLGSVLNITCRATGIPVPIIIWRRNWGHVPDKCSSTSSGGFGSLYCPDMQREDSGAYSCEVINTVGTIFVVPDTIVIIDSGDVCPAGLFNKVAVRRDECINCFCFGIVNQCKSADMFVYHLPPPITSKKIVNVERSPYGDLKISDYSDSELISLGHGIQFRASNVPYSVQQVPYLDLSPEYYGNQLKSYGGSLKYEAQFIGRGEQINTPDVILVGNGFTLTYNHPNEMEPNIRNPVKAQFVPGLWVKQDGRQATREEIMMVLANVENILIRLQYIDATERQVEITYIILDSASTDDKGLGSANLVEQCICPSGYTGFSCESCAPGYRRQIGGSWLGKCVPEDDITCKEGTYGNPKNGIPCRPCPCPIANSGNYFARGCHLGPNNDAVCDCLPGYAGRRCEFCEPGYEGNPLAPGGKCRKISTRCNPIGTELIASDGSCQCKLSVGGSYCDVCSPGSFHLSPYSPTGCIECFCMGATRQCFSSSWYRDTIHSSFRGERRDHGFSVISNYDTPNINSAHVQTFETGNELQVEARSGDDVLYWSLPEIFLGNKITSYGGNLNYTIRYNPLPGGMMSRNVAPDVVIKSSNGQKILHYRKTPVPPSVTQSYSIPIIESFWQRSDGITINRANLLMVLADIEYIFIKATYTTVTQNAALSHVSLDTAIARNIGTARAVEVEQCTCPPGYSGLSCENCALGYKKSEIDGRCSSCNCNNHSNECDSRTGICYNCRDNTEGDHCERCVSGYKGDATLGSPFGCQPIGDEKITCNSCDPFGVLNCINDQCICKSNVVGPTCNQCRPGTFNLKDSNRDGCSECFCSGVTTSCSSEIYSRTENPVDFFVDEFTLNDYDGHVIIESGIDRIVEEAAISYNRPLYTTHFWSLPTRFLGSQVKSYGGYLHFTIKTMDHDQQYIPDQDIVISGNGVKLIWTRPRYVENNDTISVKLHENDGWLLEDGRLANRRDILKVLSNVDHILIRANPQGSVSSALIRDITLETAVKGGQRTTTDIETCYCPPEYSGTSCESCAPLHYRNVSQRNGEFGACLPCPCNEGYTTSCSMNNGRVDCHCINGYGGDRCESESTTRPYAPPPLPTSSPTIQVEVSTPEIMILDVGQTVTIECTGEIIATRQPITVFWYRLNNRMPETAILENNRLHLKNLQTHDSGIYVCQGKDNQELVEKKVSITVIHGGGTAPTLSPPTVTLNTPYLQTEEYQPAEAYCEVTGYPEPYITWSRIDEQPLSPYITTNKGQIRFTSAQKFDEGTYKCTAQNKLGIDTAILEMYVISRPPTTTPPSKKVIVIDPPSYNGNEGDRVQLTCTISDEDRADYRWLKENRELYENGNIEIRENVLTIISARPGDSGVYTCSVYTPQTQMTHSSVAYVTIQPRTTDTRPQSPRIRPIESKSLIVQGQNFTVNCETSDGSPYTTIKWTKVHETFDSNVKQVGNTLQITNAQPENRGIYVCIAENQGGTDEANVAIDVEPRERPLIEIHPREPQYVRADESVILNCRAIGGIPTPKITWKRKDGKPISTRAQINTDYNSLMFEHIQPDDAGEYECHGHNIVGHISEVGVIHVSEPPLITLNPPSETIELTEGDELRIKCIATGNPLPSIKWTDDRSRTILPQSKFYGLESPNEAVLEIYRITQGDSRLYTCTATNLAGSDVKYVYVNVKPRRGDTGLSDVDYTTQKPLKNIYTADIGDNSTLSCHVEGVPKNQTRWERIDGKPLPRGSYYHENDLIIPIISEDAVGVYECLLSENNRFIPLITAELILIPIPRISFSPPMPMTVRPGENVEILCHVTGEQPIEMEWYAENHRPLPNSVRVDGPYLRFSAITPDDAGRYFCLASNRHGNVTKVAEVLVNRERTQPPSTATSHEVYEGQGVSLDCSFPYGPTSNMRFNWKKENGEISPLAHFENNRLILSSVRRSDEGRYICEVIQQNGIVSVNQVNLFVKRRSAKYDVYCMVFYICTGYEPVVIRPTIVNQYNRPITTRLCKANDFKCISHPHTCIIPARVCDGIYDCTDHSDELNCAPSSSPYNRYKRWKKDRINKNLSARNTASRNTIIDYPLLKLEPQHSYLTVGSSAEVHCFSSAGNKVNIVWERADGGPFPRHIRQFNNTLVIRNAQLSDSGEYICKCETDEGDYYTAKYELNIAEESRIKKPKVEHVEVGKNIKLSCDTDQFPSTFKWSRQSGQIQPGKDINNNELRLDNVQTKDAGTYLCTVTHEGGETEEHPVILVVTGAIPRFPQAPFSYIAFPRLDAPDASKFSMKITFKPERNSNGPNGLLLFVGKRNDNYFSLSLNGGHPEVRYNISRALRSVRSERPITMGEWHTLKVYRNRRDALMYIDDQPPVAFPDDSHYFKKSLDLSDNLYIGGYPKYENLPLEAVEHKQGFTGCVSYLMVQDKNIDLNEEAIRKEGVTSCEPCAEEPCQNEGVCLESQTEMGYTCTCQTGYTGRHCAVQGNTCSPGVCGSGRCENGELGIECYCPLNKTGDRCQYIEHLDESSISFKNGSYAAYKGTKNAKVNFTLHIRPNSLEDSVILYIAESKLVSGDYVAVVLRDKHIEMIVNYGGRVEPYILRSPSPIQEHKWTEIHAVRQYGENILRVGDQQEIRGKPPGVARFLNLKTNLYVGGYDRRIHVHENLNVPSAFDGCISNLRVHYENYNLIGDILDAANVQNCGDSNEVAPPSIQIKPTGPIDACSSEPCRNGGTCISENNGRFYCLCPLPFTGETCVEDADISTNAHFSADSYLELENNTLSASDLENTFLVILFSTTDPNGLLLWHGQNKDEELTDNQDFLAIALINGQIEYAIRFQGKNITLRTNEPFGTFHDGKPHIILAKRYRFEATLEIEKKVVYTPEENTFFIHTKPIYLPGPVYLGGAPDLNQLTGGRYPKGFNGCIHILENESGSINLLKRAKSGVNVRECSKQELHTESPSIA